ncbi:MAG: hypothetical protein ABI855_04120 [Bacteroidota bacterium]
MRNLSFLIATMIVCSSFTSSDETDKKVMMAAQENLSSSLSKIPVGKENQFGFTGTDEFSKCIIGKPYRLITLNNAFFTDEILTSKNYLLEQDEWRVPVMVNDQNRLLLTVTGQSDIYSVVDLGGMVLAKELQKKSKDFKSSDTRFILRIYPLSADFLVKAGSNSLTNAEYIPLTSALMGIDGINSNAKPEYSLSEVLQLIKQELKNHPKN